MISTANVLMKIEHVANAMKDILSIKMEDVNKLQNQNSHKIVKPQKMESVLNAWKVIF